MKRLDFTIISAILLISLIYLSSAMTASFLKEQIEINKIFQKEVYKSLKEEKKDKLTKEQKSTINAKITINIIEDVLIIHNNDGKNLERYINNKYINLNKEYRKELISLYSLKYEKMIDNVVYFLILFSLIFILNVISFMFRTYSYFGKNRLYLSSFLYCLPLSNLYFVLFKGKDKTVEILNINKMIKLREVIDFKVITEKYNKIINENKNNSFNSKIYHILTSINIIKWIKTIRPIFKSLFYLISFSLIFTIISYTIIDREVFLTPLIMNISLLIFLITFILITDYLQYKKILTFTTKEERGEVEEIIEEEKEEVPPRLKLRTNIFKRNEGEVK